MRFKAPDERDTADTSAVEDRHSFEEEIKLILKISEIPDKYIIDAYEADAPDCALKVLLKFTQMCREEIFPRHNKAVEAIQSKSEAACVRAEVQRRQLASLSEERARLAESAHRLERARADARLRNAALTLRLKVTLRKLQDGCTNKTAAEKQLACDLVELKKKAEDLRVAVTESKAKSNYYDTQVNAQMEIVLKNSKPLYLDNNRAIFMRKHFNSMRQNIEDLMRRVKTLKTRTENLVHDDTSVCLNDGLNDGMGKTNLLI